MIEKNTKKAAQEGSNRRDHLANERTFLAWIRTNLGIMALGFVVEKFSFFLEEVASFLGKSEPKPSTAHSTLQGYSSIFGISLIGIGALLCLFAFLKFKKTEKQINDDTYRSSIFLDTILALFIFFIGVSMIIYLISTHDTV